MKKYIIPAITVIALDGEGHILTGSTREVSVSNDTRDSYE